MMYLSLFAGIEAASVAWKPLGWTCVGVAEIEPFACAVLAHHYPNVPNLGSVTDITDEQIAALGPIDVVVGGSPCQDLSVAGKRAGLAGERSGLFHEQLRIFHAARHLCGARFLVWENVPGAFSSHAGRDFAVVVGAMAGCRVDVPEDGWGTEGVVVGEHGLVEWAVLDAQWFGVAQRRRRVFAVLDVGDWSGRPPILLERDSLRGDSAPSREAGQRVAPVLAGCSNGGGANGPGRDVDSVESLQVISMAHGQGGAEIGFDRGPTLTCNHEAPIVAHTLRGEGFDAGEDGTGRGTPLVPVAFNNTGAGWWSDAEVAATVRKGDEQGGGGARESTLVPVAFAENSRAEVRLEGGDGGRVGAISTGGGKPGQGVPMIAFMADDYKDGGGQVAVVYGEIDACTQKADPHSPLRALREAVGAQAFAEWGLGILDSLHSSEVLRQAMHGVGVRLPAFSRSWVVCCALGSPFSRSEGVVQSLREAGCTGCSPQGWEPPEQLARELGTYLSGLSHPGAQAERLMRDLWRADEGTGVLREALSAIQEARRSAHGQGEPARAGLSVRRLTTTECTFLQGFPRNYLDIAYRGKPAADGPKYKALGNSFAVPVVRWIGEQIQRAAA